MTKIKWKAVNKSLFLIILFEVNKQRQQQMQ